MKFHLVKLYVGKEDHISFVILQGNLLVLDKVVMEVVLMEMMLMEM